MTLSNERIQELRAIAHRLRVDVLTMVHAAKCGHPGGPLGMADFMTVLFMEHLNLNPENLNDPGRDRFVLGNGHTCAGYYALLAAKGLIERKELLTFRKLGSRLQGHPHRTPEMGIDFSTGSLGTGLSAAAGMALGIRLNGDAAHVYCTSSDGDSQEGQTWEAATSSAHFDLSNLTVIVDFNNIQIDGKMREIMNVRDLRVKYDAFGWNAIDVDGHDMLAMDQVLSDTRDASKPTAIIAHTILGKGVAYMEGESAWHGVAPNDEQFAVALAELGSPD